MLYLVNGGIAMKRNYKLIFSLFGLVMTLTVNAFKYQNINNKIETVENNFLEKVECKANQLLEELESISRNMEAIELNPHYSSMNVDEPFDSKDIDLCEWQIQYIYNELEDEAKETIEENLNSIPEIELIYRIGTNQEFDIDAFINNNLAIQEALYDFGDIDEDFTTSVNEDDAALTRNPLKSGLVLAGVSLAEKVVAAIIAAVKTAFCSISIPFVGWCIAAIAIVALAVIIASNWNTIKKCIYELKAYLMAQFVAISALIASTVDKAINDNQKTVYFPSNPYLFTPCLVLNEYKGTGNGKILRWNNGNTCIFRWDEDLRYGSHYHTINDNFTYHWHAGEKVPQNLVNLYF